MLSMYTNMWFFWLTRLCPQMASWLVQPFFMAYPCVQQTDAGTQITEPRISQSLSSFSSLIFPWPCPCFPFFLFFFPFPCPSFPLLSKFLFSSPVISSYFFFIFYPRNAMLVRVLAMTRVRHRQTDVAVLVYKRQCVFTHAAVAVGF